MKRVGFYSGSFDPVTKGHTDIIERAARMCDTLVIGIGVPPGNAPLFSPSSAMIFSAVGIELWRKPTVVVTTRTRLGVCAGAGKGEFYTLDKINIIVNYQDFFVFHTWCFVLPVRPSVRRSSSSPGAQIGK